MELVGTAVNDGRMLISFDIAGQGYCVDVMAVREIRGWTQATSLPASPAHVRGVINLRGTVLPVVDLATRLELGTTTSSARNVIIVVDIAGQLVGLLVDAVSEIFTVAAKDVQATPEIGSEEVKRMIKGVITTTDGRLLSWLALEYARLTVA